MKAIWRWILRFKQKVIRPLDLFHLRTFFYNRAVSIDENLESIPGVSAYWRIAYDKEFICRAEALSGEAAVEPEQEVFVCCFTKVDLQVTTGALGVEGDRVIAESSTWPESAKWPVSRQRSARSYVYRPKTLERISGGTYATIMTHHRNFYHWFIDTLPRFYSLVSLNLDSPVTLLVPTDLNLVQRTSLMWCLPENFTVKFVEDGSWLTVENLLFPSLVRARTNLYLPKEHVDYVRSAVFRNVPLPPAPKPGRRVYISRSLGRRRLVLNDPDVLSCLAKYGFEITHPENLTIEEQVALFHSAEWIVAPHGAGLTNMLFAKHAKILEFMREPPPHISFRRLANILGHEHHYVPAEQEHKNDHMRVDVASLERKLVELGA